MLVNQLRRNHGQSERSTIKVTHTYTIGSALILFYSNTCHISSLAFFLTSKHINQSRWIASIEAQALSLTLIKIRSCKAINHSNRHLFDTPFLLDQFESYFGSRYACRAMSRRFSIKSRDCYLQGQLNGITSINAIEKIVLGSLADNDDAL